MAWSTPIIDRTQADVDYAFANQNSTSDLKGAFNVSDANRIINNSAYLKTLLESYGYTVTGYTTQSAFVETDIPYITSKIGVMKNNIIALVNAFYSSGNPTITFGENLNFEIVNDMENNLNITNQLLINMIATLRYCGEYICGKTFLF